MTGGKVRQYLYFVRLLHTSTPLTNVELSKKWRNSGFHGQGWTWLKKDSCVHLPYSADWQLSATEDL